MRFFLRILLCFFCLPTTLAFADMCAQVFPSAPVQNSSFSLSPPGTSTASLDLSGGAVLNIAAGNNTFFADATLGNGVSFNVTGSGTARLHFDGSVDIGNNLRINQGGDPEDLVIFINGDLTVGANAQVNAIVYVSGTVNISNNGSINGALTSGRSISTGNDAAVNFDQDAINNADFANLCDASAGPLVCQTYRDEFSVQSFANNNGTLRWQSDWQEFDRRAAGTTTGDILITGGRLRITGDDNELNNNSMTRQASGRGFITATLTFDFDPSSGLESDDQMLIEVSTDGGNNFTLLDTLQGLQGNPGVINYSRDLTSDLADDMRIRIRVAPDDGTGACCFGPSNEFIDFDNIQLQVCRPDNFQWEGGVVDVDIGSPATINFSREYDSPVVFAMAMSESPDPTHVRVVSTSSNSAQIIAVEPPPNPDGIEDGIGTETINFIVAEEGVFTLSDGKKIEVGKAQVDAIQRRRGSAFPPDTPATSLDSISLLPNFASAPVLLTGLATNNNGNNNHNGLFNIPWIYSAMTGLNNDSFLAALGRADVAIGTTNQAETYTYLAIDAGSLPDFVHTGSRQIVTAEAQRTANRLVNSNCTSQPLNQTYTSTSPGFVSTINTLQGGDGGWVRGCSSSPTAFLTRVQEDRFLRAETFHLAESTSTIIFDIIVEDLVDHYAINHDGMGITCLLEEITITAEDDMGAAVDADGASITISTSSGRGNWVGVVSGASGLNNGTSDNGTATFTFDAGVSSAVLTLAHPVLNGTRETFGFNVTDGTTTETSNAADAADDPDITYSLAGFRFIDSQGGSLPNQISGNASDVAPNAEMLYLQAVRASDNNPGVCLAAFSNPSTRAIELAAQCDNPNTCTASGQTFTVAGTSVALNDATPATPSNFTSVNLTFDNQARAEIPLSYSDAGQMQLHARFTEPDTGAVLTGSSDQFVVRPFAFGLSSISAGLTANPAGDELTGSGFVSAGSDFSASVNAYRYQAGDDINSDGVPDAGADVTDNGVTPNFTGVVSLSVDSFTPASGVPGSLSGDTGLNIAQGSANTVATLQYDEVGSINLQADHNNYLGVSGLNITSVAQKVGRFFPDHFALASSGVTSACGAFTYMQQPFGAVNIEVAARNVAGTVTENYDISRYTGTASFQLDAQSNGLSQSARLGVGSFPSWQRGVASGVVSDVVFQRQPNRTGLEDGPFTGLQLGMSIATELDSVNFRSADFNLLSGTAIAIGSAQEVRYGRVKLSSAHGPETQDLPVPFTVEYWNGSNFVINTADSSACSAIPLTAINFDGSTIDDPAQRSVTLGSGSTTGSLNINVINAQAAAGDYGLIFSAPGADAAGAFPLQLNSLNDWLRYDWSGNDQANELPPEAIVTFGRVRGDDRTIFWQERLE